MPPHGRFRPGRSGRDPLRRRRLPWALATAVFILSPGTAGAADPDLDWRTIETPHFRLSFPDYLERIARRAAAALERAHAALAPFMGHEPERPTEVVITDETDDANGSATALPFDIMRLFAIPPADFSPLQEYDDWLYMLVVHEYTHILHLDNIGGLAPVVNAIFGRVWAPNHVQPRFILEGIATLVESRETGRGRVGSTIFDMYLRMATLDDSLLRIDQVANGPTTWPHGETYYLYGSYFFDFIVRRHGPGAIAALADEYGDDLLPFGINRAIEDVTGETFVEMFDAWQDELRETFGAQEAAVEADGLAEGDRIVTDAEIVRAPRFSPDGRRVGYFGYDGYDQTSLYAVDLRSGDRETLRVVSGSAAMSWAPDGRGFVYHRSETYRNYYGFYDLFAVSADGDDLRLTDGLRAREPDLDRSGERVACVLAAPGGWSIATMGADGSGLEIVLPGPEDSQLYTPRWSPDGGSIAFSAKTAGDTRDIWVLDVAGGGLVRLTSDEATDAGPAWSPDGSLVFFSSDRTGIADIYATEPATGRTWRVTNVVGGAFQPDVSPDGSMLAFVGYTSSGYDLRTMPLDPGSWREVDRSTPARVDSLDGGVASPDDPAPGVPRSRPYDPWQTAAPRSWAVRYASTGVEPIVTVEVLGQDVAGSHTLGGSVDIGTDDGAIGYRVGYSYGGWNPYLSVGHSRYTQVRRDLSIDGEPTEWAEEGYSATGEVTLPVLAGDHGQWFTLGYNFNWNRPRDGGFDVPEDPNHLFPGFPQTGILSGLTFAWQYSNTRGATYVPGRNYGFGLAASTHLSDPALGSDYETIDVAAAVAAFFAAPWARSHAIAARLAGGLGRSDSRGRGIFFLGGFPEQDFFRGILYGEAMGGVALRGYDPYSVYGSRYALANIEYRLPIVEPNAGLWTLPGYLRRITASAFCDVGAASWSEISPDDIKVGAGAELFVQAAIGYYIEFSVRVGYAYGFMDPGGHDFYVVLGAPF